MIQTPVRNPLDDVADFLATAPSDEQVLAYFLSDDLQERLQQLLELNRAGVLTNGDERDLDDFIRADHMISRLKTKARLRQRGVSDDSNG